MALNLYDLFRQTACGQPRQPAILSANAEPLSYGALDEAIQGAGRGLRQAGVRPGDCVGLHLASGVDYIVGNYAVWSCGACVVPMPMELRPNEKHEIARVIALDWIISRSDTASFLEPLRPGLPTMISHALSLLPVARLREHPAGFHGVNSAFIRFTSGTTGAAKGVVLSHETIRDRMQAANEVIKIGPDDRVVWLLSMSYHFAVSIVAYLTYGAGIILTPNTLGPTILGATRRQRGTLIYGSPIHYQWMAGAEAAASLDSLRLALSTTSALSAQTGKAFAQRFGLPLTQCLGIIEIGLPCINVDFAGAHPEAVGRVLPAYRLRLDDVGLGPELRETAFSGPGFLDAYYHPWQTRRDIMPDGWFRTGDVGQVDGAGCLFLRGRKKDVINVMGMKFFPQEVEAVLMGHPWVESACVFAERDPRLGETPCARVIVKAHARNARCADVLRDYCHKRLADYKVPQRIDFVEALPRTASGKILHRNLDADDAHDRNGAEPLGRHA